MHVIMTTKKKLSFLSDLMTATNYLQCVESQIRKKKHQTLQPEMTY